MILRGSSTSLMTGVFVLLFSTSVVIFVFVFSFCKVTYFLARPDPRNFDRRRGFSNRATAAMFAVTVINFIIFSLGIGTQVAIVIVAIRKALILNIDFLPFSEMPDKALLQSMDIVGIWAEDLPVSAKLLLLDPVSIHGWWR